MISGKKTFNCEERWGGFLPLISVIFGVSDFPYPIDECRNCGGLRMPGNKLLDCRGVRRLLLRMNYSNLIIQGKTKRFFYRSTNTF